MARLAQQAQGLLDPNAGAEGLRGLEGAVRAAMGTLGATLLENLLAADSGHRGTRVDCGGGHKAAFVATVPSIWTRCSGRST